MRYEYKTRSGHRGVIEAATSEEFLQRMQELNGQYGVGKFSLSAINLRDKPVAVRGGSTAFDANAFWNRVRAMPARGNR